MAHHDTTVVFVPGAWHSPDSFDAVITHLHAANYKTSKVYTPSVLRDGQHPTVTFDDDVAEIRKHIEKATGAGQKVLLVMHSYGGASGAQAVEGLDQATLASNGHKDGRGVVHLVYLAAFMLRNGESCVHNAQSSGPADWIMGKEDGSVFPIDPARVFYNDFDSQELSDRFVANLNPHCPVTLVSEVKYEPWKIVPTTYLACEYDNAVPIVAQKAFVREAIGAGATDLRMIYWKCGHTPFAVKPWETSLVIRAAVGDIEKLPVVVESKPSLHSTVNAVDVTA